MKGYTDLEQSKKLAEILPLESADMWWNGFVDEEHFIIWDGYPSFLSSDICTPCWSLAALLDILESEIYGEDGETYELNIERDGTWWFIKYLERYNEASPIETYSTKELIDACVEMILKLNELNLL